MMAATHTFYWSWSYVLMKMKSMAVIRLMRFVMANKKISSFCWIQVLNNLFVSSPIWCSTGVNRSNKSRASVIITVSSWWFSWRYFFKSWTPIFYVALIDSKFWRFLLHFTSYTLSCNSDIRSTGFSQHMTSPSLLFKWCWRNVIVNWTWFSWHDRDIIIYGLFFYGFEI